MNFLFSSVLFLSAFLLFSIQPMAAKSLLPVYGGTPAVWTVCMFFFQSIIFFAYTYVTVLSSNVSPIKWRSIHCIVLAFSFIMIPLNVHTIWINGSPEWSILLNLVKHFGLPLIVLGASAPLLQFAFSHTSAAKAPDPYYLYVASNSGSLISLLIYPFIVERYVGLNNQFRYWSVLYVVYLVLALFILVGIRYRPLELNFNNNKAISWRDISNWVVLSAIPCSLMLGVSSYIATDIAATPLFWIIPLALYLLTFIIAFIPHPRVSFLFLQRNVLILVVFVILGFILHINQIKAWQTILFNLSSFFVLALLCHRQLFLKRPLNPRQLPIFYWCISIGGVVAGLFNGIIAAHWFSEIYEYPLAIIFALLALPLAFNRRITEDWWPNKVIWYLIVFPLGMILLLSSHYFLPEFHLFNCSVFQISAILGLLLTMVIQNRKTGLLSSLTILFAFIFVPSLQENHVLYQNRNFFGVKKVLDKDGVHALISQSTVHGLQDTHAKHFDGLSSYYGAIQRPIQLLKQQQSVLNAVVIGLGIGTLACQFRNTDHVKMIEIDNQVLHTAQDERYFTNLKYCPATLVEADGRVAINNLPNHSQDILIVDAFNSDAIPVHLLTLEAFMLYKQKIIKNGVVLVNLSNRHLDLLPVVNAVGTRLNLMMFTISDLGNTAMGQFASQWVLLTRNEALVFQLIRDAHWHFMTGSKQLLWTDDYSNLVPLLRF